MFVVLLIACAGEEPAPAAKPPLPELPAAWADTPRAAAPILKEARKTCASGDTRFTFKPNLSFEVANPKAKFAGTWRDVDGALVYLTKGPLGPDTHCHAARFVTAGDNEVLLCAEGPFGCNAPVNWAIEVVDDGAGPQATELIGRILAPLQAEGPGIVYANRDRSTTNGGTIQIRYRTSQGSLRRPHEIAAAAAQRIDVELETEAVEVIEDPEIDSPVLILVDGAVTAPRHTR